MASHTSIIPALSASLVYVSLALGIISAVLYIRGLSRAIMAASVLSVISYAFASMFTFIGAFLDPQGILVIHEGALVHDRFTSLILVASSLGALVAVAGSLRAAGEWPTSPGYYTLTPLILYGVYYLSGAVEPALILASWLLLSVASYVMIALPGDKDSSAAAARYIFVGTLATLFLVLWIAGLIARFNTGPVWPAIVAVSALASLGFKIGVFPFSWWLPSVYGRANGIAVAVVAGVAKLAFISLLARLLSTIGQAPTFSPLYPGSEPFAVAHVVALAAVATMTLGNIAALTTSNFQHMLAYSSLAQAGYILVGMAALTVSYSIGVDPYLPLAGIALQALAYSLAKSSLFIMAAETRGRIRGVLRGDAASTASVAVLLASLLGIPILIGFWGKLYLFLPASSYSILLVAIALANSGVSSAYYIRFLREALSSDGDGGLSPSTRMSLTLAAALTLLLGVMSPVIAGLMSP